MNVKKMLKALNKKSEFVVEYKTTSSKSVAGNSTTDFSINIAKDGYKPIGIVGHHVGYAPFSFIRESISGNTASVTLRNILSSSQGSGTVGVYILYQKMGGGTE